MLGISSLGESVVFLTGLFPVAGFTTGAPLRLGDPLPINGFSFLEATAPTMGLLGAVFLGSTFAEK
ncbi:predicted protein [Arabidopsis lyrata subsp. lyrata]|uniref:Predicted protein n=1 Tax=Arabidopsis lyrata subsp. lyrata TaxID=81972 RepID=D7L9E8_ARALL|nr:predicted protein [Arabidopsis lyrata subsp. lyrata]